MLRGKVASRFSLICIFAVLILAICPWLGFSFITPFSLHSNPEAALIFWSIRIPRTLIAFLAGSSLALAGMVFQAIFRNPLASPFTLGVASGAAFGAAIFFNLGLNLSLFGFSLSTIFSMAGALLTMTPIYFLTRSDKNFSGSEILLAGVVLSFFFSSAIMFLQYISDFSGILRMTRWLMGGFELVSYEAVAILAPCSLIVLCLCVAKAKELDLFMIGEELAASRGLDVRKSKLTFFCTISLLVGAVVAFCGPISSVGVMAPHICRLLIGAEHLLLGPASFLFGGAFVVICDTLARTVIAPYEIPVGVLTSMTEGPFFLWLLWQRSWRP